MRKFKRLAALTAVCAMVGGAVAPAALAGEPVPPKDDGKCNAGNGNGSDVVTFVEGAHCYGGDPGNSYNADNKGGDEIPTSDGVPNPGGNNVP